MFWKKKLLPSPPLPPEMARLPCIDMGCSKYGHCSQVSVCNYKRFTKEHSGCTPEHATRIKWIYERSILRSDSGDW